MVGAKPAHLRQSKSTYERFLLDRLDIVIRDSSTDFAADTIIMKKDWNFILGQMHVGFNRGDAEIQRRLEPRQGILRFKATSASMSLQIERNQAAGCHRVNGGLLVNAGQRLV